MRSDITKAEQVRRQYEAVAQLAKTLAMVHEQSAFMAKDGADDGLLDIMGRQSAYAMEALGDILNGMDAASEEDAALGDVFDVAHTMFPLRNDEA